MGKLRDCALASFAVVAAARAGVIQGIVLEQASGLPLARTQVRLDPVPDPGKPVPPLQTMTNRTGGFIFPAVPAGLYLVSCRRAEYFPAAYGQRRPSGQGTAVQVTADSTLFAELRLTGSKTARKSYPRSDFRAAIPARLVSLPSKWILIVQTLTSVPSSAGCSG